MGKLMVGVARILPLCALISIFLSGIAAQPAHAQLRISIRSVYTTDENQNNKNVFMPGDKINYHVDVENTTNSPFPVDIRFQAFDNGFVPDPRLYVYDQTYHVDQLPVGLSRFYNPAILPSNAEISANLYAARITITRSDCQGVDCAKDVAENTFTIQMTKAPEGKAPNLIVLVHGCCTDENDVVQVWGNGTSGIPGMAKAIAYDLQNRTSEAWEVVVWDWHEYTPKHDYRICPLCFKPDADAAYQAATSQGGILANAIKLHPIYKHVHFISHSAGAKLIHEAATAYISDYFIWQKILSYIRHSLTRIHRLTITKQGQPLMAPYQIIIQTTMQSIMLTALFPKFLIGLL